MTRLEKKALETAHSSLRKAIRILEEENAPETDAVRVHLDQSDAWLVAVLED